MANELIKVQTTEQGEQQVSARELHKALDSKKKFSDWWKQWGVKYVDGIDYFAGHSEVTTNQYGATKLMDDYFLTTETAKSISMLTDTPRGDQVRNYFIAVEKEHKALMADPRIQMAMGLKSAQLMLDHKDKIIAEMKPKAIFADAVNTSKQSILVGDLAKLISQNGVKIGQNRLFAYMRDNGYLHKSGSQYNRPTQRYIDQGLFEVKESSHTNPDGSTRLTFTTKVTGKGQQYFVNKFLGEANTALEV